MKLTQLFPLGHQHSYRFMDIVPAHPPAPEAATRKKEEDLLDYDVQRGNCVGALVTGRALENNNR